MHRATTRTQYERSINEASRHRPTDSVGFALIPSPHLPPPVVDAAAVPSAEPEPWPPTHNSRFRGASPSEKPRQDKHGRHCAAARTYHQPPCPLSLLLRQVPRILDLKLYANCAIFCYKNYSFFLKREYENEELGLRYCG